jgi:hypothetical protein
VASKAKNGNSDILLNYTYSDNLTAANLKQAYYRLRSVAYNGTSTISRIVYIRADEANTGSTTVWNVYPNPATDFLNINSVNAGSNPTNIQLTNTTGAVMMSQTIGSDQNGQATLNLSNLPNGQYFLQVSDDKGMSYKQQVTVIR